MNVFLSCTKEKASSRCKAKDMYMPSSLFEKSYNYAKDILKADHIYILSAKHHLLGLNEEIEPYNETLNDASVEERKEWTEEVLKQMKSRHIDFSAKTYFLCGENYIEFLEEHFKDSKSLYKGKGIGEIMHWLDRKLGNKTNECISLKEYILESLNESLNLDQYFGFKYKFVQPIFVPYENTFNRNNKYINESGLKKFRKENKDILKALSTSSIGSGKNCYTRLSGYSDDVVGICTAIILAPVESSIDDLENILNQYGKNITIKETDKEIDQALKNSWLKSSKDFEDKYGAKLNVTYMDYDGNYVKDSFFYHLYKDNKYLFTIQFNK